MNDLTFRLAGPAMTSSELEAAEKVIGRKLPPKYRAFLFRQNGGQPSKRIVHIQQHPQGDDYFDYFWGVHHPEPAIDLLKRFNDFPEYAKRGYFPIGDTAGGSLLCIDLSDPGGESIVYIDVADADPPETRRAYFVGSDIDDFCARLKSPG